MKAFRRRWAATAVLLDLAAVVIVAVAIGGLSPGQSDHDAHFGDALAIIARFQWASAVLTALSLLALTVALIGIARKHERGAVPVLSVVISIVLTTVGIIGWARLR
jgi:uncharacterized membrane protein YozB (DUF420 family)